MIWAILKHYVKRRNPTTKQELRDAINAVWQEMNADIMMLRRMMTSIPARLQAVIACRGRQVFKADYKRFQ